MPTTRPRHMITESDRIAEALKSAELLWPELRGDSSALLRKILETGMAEVQKSVATRAESRLGAISKAAGSLSGTWPSNWRDELRDEWPA